MTDPDAPHPDHAAPTASEGTRTPTPGRDAAGAAVAAVADDALHGSYCPKLCTHACPVTAATGRETAVPWGFHRTVSDLADGRLPVHADVAARLTDCSGCLACQQPCAFDQDVPAQVRAGRAALVDADVAPTAVTDAVAHVTAGRTPWGVPTLEAPPVAGPVDGPVVTLLTGCRDEADAVHAAVALLAAAGERVAVAVPDGCCGALLDDLGAREAGDRARGALPTVGDGPVVATDPHCLPSLRAAGHEARDLATHLAAAVTEQRLRFAAADADTAPEVTWHDPCVLARGEGVTEAPRDLLDAAGAHRLEAAQHGATTGCSGGGLGLDLLDPDVADATAAARATALPDVPVVTGCGRAQQRLAAAGREVHDLAVWLQGRLTSDPPAPDPTEPESRP